MRSDYQTALLLIFAFVVIAIVAYPFVVLLLKSLGIANYHFSGFNFQSYNDVLQGGQLISPLYTTLVIACGITALTLAVGTALAWLVTRTDFKHKRLVNGIVFLTFTIPSYILGISWLEFFGRNGYLNRFYKVLGWDYHFKAYSILAVIVVMSIHLYPLVFIALVNAFKRVDNSLEDAAVLSGARRIRVFFTITLPLVLPTLWSVGLFVFSRSMANFGVPALLLMPIYKETLTTGIYRSLNNLDFSAAAAISMILVVVSSGVFVLQQLFLKNKKFTTISSNSGKAKLIKLGKKSTLISALVFVLQIITTILPIVILVITSFMKRWGLPLEANSFTLNNYEILFTSELAHRALFNSVLFGGVAAAVAIVISLLVSYISHFTSSKLGKPLEFTAAFPMVIPNIVMAIAAILAWNKGLFNFYGTPTIIILTYTALFLPIVIKQIAGLAHNYDRSLEQAARVSGASAVRSAKDILLPFISPAIRSSFVLCLLIALREIPIALMLHAPGTETVGVLLFNMRSNSAGLEATSTVATVVIALSLIGRLILRTHQKKRGDML